jgi:hypothetical protein
VPWKLLKNSTFAYTSGIQSWDEKYYRLLAGDDAGVKPA